MQIIFLLPMVVGIVASLVFLFTEVGWLWKLIVLGLVGLSVSMQFVPELHTHFLVPTIIQCGVGVALLIYFKAEGYF